MSKPILSKSTYIRSLQCLKSLYLYKFYYNQRDAVSREQQAIFERGHSVGKLAHQLFPGGVDASAGAKLKSQNALLKTYELIQSGCKIIYEASFAYDGVWVIADILLLSDNEWKVYEVKSSVEVSETFLADAALQYYVISNALPQITGSSVFDFSIIHVNRNYELVKTFDVQNYFLIKSVKNYCEEQTEFVKTKIAKATATLENGKIPAIETGDHCLKPYTCDFYGTCWRKKPLQAISEKLKLNEGKIHSLIPNSDQVIYVLEFLKARPAIPVFDGMHPYENLMFHFSIGKFQNGSASYYQFTADSGVNSNKTFIGQLLKHTSEPGIIFINEFVSKEYVIKELIEKNPEYSEQLQSLKQQLANIFSLFDFEENYAENIEDIYQLLQIKKPFIKSNVYDKPGAIKSFMNMQKQDMFEAMDTKVAIENYGLMAMKKLGECITTIMKKSKVHSHTG